MLFTEIRVEQASLDHFPQSTVHLRFLPYRKAACYFNSVTWNEPNLNLILTASFLAVFLLNLCDVYVPVYTFLSWKGYQFSNQDLHCYEDLKKESINILI